MNNLKNLRASLPSTMAGLSSQANLKLAFGNPSTDGETIWVSDIPLNPTREEYFLVISDLMHEIGHILYTDFKHIKEGLLGSLVNIFEDVRVEEELEKKFLGAKTFLNEGYKFTLKNPRPEPSTEIESLLFFIYLKYQIEVNKRKVFNPVFKTFEKEINKSFPKDILGEVVTLCDLTVPELSSTEDCFRLSEEVIKIISKNSPIKEDTLDSEISNPLSLRSEALNILGNVDKDNSSKFFYGNSDDLAKEMVLSSNGNKASEKNFYNEAYLETDIAAYNALKQCATTEIQSFRKYLVPHWTNQNRTRKLLNEDNGVFSIGAAINCLASGEDKFLIKRAKKEDKKPAICLLADYSDSMNHLQNGTELIDIQSRTMIGLIEACNIANVPLNLLGFSDLVFRIKTWQEPMSRARGIIGGRNTITGTKIVPAVFEAIRSFSSRKEKRKICIVLTDGEIGLDKKALLNLMDYAKKYHPDIEFYGLGIDVNLSDIFPKGGEVSPQNISNTVLNILTG